MSQLFYAIGFPSALSPNIYGRPIVGQLECYCLKDEDVLLLSRGIMFHFRFHAMRVVRREKGCVYQLQLDSCCVLFRGLGGLVAARFIQTERICTFWLNPGWFPMKYVELYKDGLNSVVV